MTLLHAPLARKRRRAMADPMVRGRTGRDDNVPTTLGALGPVMRRSSFKAPEWLSDFERSEVGVGARGRRARNPDKTDLLCRECPASSHETDPVGVALSALTMTHVPAATQTGAVGRVILEDDAPMVTVDRNTVNEEHVPAGRVARPSEARNYGVACRGVAAPLTEARVADAPKASLLAASVKAAQAPNVIGCSPVGCHRTAVSARQDCVRPLL